MISDSNATAWRDKAAKDAQEAGPQYLDSDKCRVAKKKAAASAPAAQSSEKVEGMCEQKRKGRRRASTQTTLAMRESSLSRDGPLYRDVAWEQLREV